MMQLLKEGYKGYQNKKGSEGIEALLAETGGQGNVPPLSAAQQGNLQRQNDPLQQLLNGASGAPIQQSHLPPPGAPDPRLQALIAQTEAIKKAKGGAAAFDYLAGAMNPAQADTRALEHNRAQQSELTLEQMQQQNDAFNQLQGMVGQNPRFSNPVTQAALRTQTPSAAGASVLSASGIGGKGNSGIGQVSPNQYTPESLQAFYESRAQGTPDYSLLKRPDAIKDIAGIDYYTNPLTGKLEAVIPPDQQLKNLEATGAADASGTALNKTYFDLSKGHTTRLQSIENLTKLENAIASGSLGTGVLEGRVQLPNAQKEMLYSEALKAARAWLKASGETRTTDTDVKQAMEALFGATRTEEFNIHTIQQIRAVMEQTEAQYELLSKMRQAQGLSVLDNTGGGSTTPSSTSAPDRTAILKKYGL